MDIKTFEKNMRKMQLGELKPNSPYKYLSSTTSIGYMSGFCFSPLIFFKLLFDFDMLGINEDRSFYDKISYAVKKMKNIFRKNNITNVNDLNQFPEDGEFVKSLHNIFDGIKDENHKAIIKDIPEEKTHLYCWEIISRYLQHDKNEVFDPLIKVTISIYSQLEKNFREIDEELQEQYELDREFADSNEEKLFFEKVEKVFSNYDLSLLFWLTDNDEGKNKPELISCRLLEGGLYFLKRFYEESPKIDSQLTPIFSIEALLAPEKKPINNFFILLAEQKGYSKRKYFIDEYQLDNAIDRETLEKYMNGSKHLTRKQYKKISEAIHKKYSDQTTCTCDNLTTTFIIARLLTYFADIFQATLLRGENQGDFKHAQKILLERIKHSGSPYPCKTELVCSGQYDIWQDHH